MSICPDWTLVVDCAYGATGPIAPRVFRHLGARVIELHTETDGARINVGCGSTDLEPLRAAVARENADLGIAFDGDGDRVLLVSSHGRTIDGDHVIGIAAVHRLSRGTLEPPLVVTTVLSNAGLERYLVDRGVEVLRTPVGDRHVAQAMLASGARIGGEPSGHVIFADHTPTGDGILTAVQLLEIAHEAGESVETLADRIPLYPQSQRNVACTSIAAARSVSLADVERRAEARLAGRGRIVVRPSGTQPMVRVFVEADELALAESVCEEAAARHRRSARRLGRRRLLVERVASEPGSAPPSSGRAAAPAPASAHRATRSGFSCASRAIVSRISANRSSDASPSVSVGSIIRAS